MLSKSSARKSRQREAASRVPYNAKAGLTTYALRVLFILFQQLNEDLVMGPCVKVCHLHIAEHKMRPSIGGRRTTLQQLSRFQWWCCCVKLRIDTHVSYFLTSLDL